ncbi:MAG TPA: S8 family peptidase [Anaerolineae bacterium]
MTPQSKIHPRLEQILSGSPRTPGLLTPKAAEIRVIVKHRPQPETLRMAKAIEGVGAVYRQLNRLIPGSALTATPDAIRILAARPDIDMIWYDEPVHINLDESVPLIGAPDVYRAGFTGKNIRVGIVDTGIDPNHPDFAGRIVEFKDFSGDGTADGHGHGTHVAGIIGGSGAASGGKYRGVAYECLYIIAKALRNDGAGLMSDIIAGLDFQLDQKAQVVNLSLGSSGSSDGTDALSVACDALVERGVVVCVAAGNDGPFGRTIGAPGAAHKVITVGATDKRDTIATFSSRGPTSDGRIKPDLCFPGVEIHSCRANGTSMGKVIDQSYTTASGTSMATPHATGSSALLLQVRPELTPQAIKDALMNSAQDLGQDAMSQGRGRARVYAAYQAIVSLAPPPPPPPPPTPVPPPPQPPPPTPPPTGGGCLQLVKTLFGVK